MADDDQGVLGGLIQSEEPWALEETQNTIKKNWGTFLSKHAKKDTKSLQEIAKNIDTLVNRGTAAEKTTLGELKKAKTANQKDSTTFNKLLGTIEKGNVRRNKNFKDLKQSVAESILKGNKKSGGLFSSLTFGLADKFADVAKGVINFDGTMGGFAKTIGTVSAIAGGMIAWIANTTDTYRSLVNVGQTFGGEMLKMNHTANRAGISLEQLAKITIKHSKLMAFRVNAEKTGMNMFTQTQLQVRKNIRAFGNYGLTLDQVTEFTAGYLDQLRLQGRLDKISNNARILATTNYMRKLSELSEITGKSRDVLAKEMKEANENVSLWARAQQRDGAVREDFIKAMENANLGFAMFGKETAAALEEMILGADQFAGNLVMTDIGGAIMSLVPDIGTAMQHIAEAVSTEQPEQVAKANAELLASVKNLTKGELEMLNIIRKDNKEADFILKLAQQGAALRLDAEGLIIKATKNRTAAEEEAAAKLAVATETSGQRMTKAATNFGDISSEIMGEARELILTAFETPISDMVGHMGDAVTGIRNLVADNKEFLTMMANKINEIGGSMTGDLSTLGKVVGGVVAAQLGIKTVGAVKAAKAAKKGTKTVADIAKGVSSGKAAGRKATGVVAEELGEEAIEALAKKSAKKAIWKALPIGIGAGAGLAFAAGRLMEGDIGGAALEAGSGIAATVPVAGTALGFAADAALLALDLQRLQEQGEAGARPKPGSPEANKAEREAAGGRWVTTGRGKRVWVPNEGGPAEGPGEEPVAGGMSSEELLSQLNEHMQNQNRILEGIGNATGATAKHSAKTADALGGFGPNNLQ